MKTINEIFNLLQQKIPHETGSIGMSFAGIGFHLKGKDAVGHLVQEWIFHWCKENSIKIVPNTSSQSFPDYFFIDDKRQQLPLEIKNFNVNESPAFDVADFYAFIETLPNDIHKLYADYLVFGYNLDQNGKFTIPRIWNMKIWDLVGKSHKNHVTCQIRNQEINAEGIDTKGRIQKLRPYNFKIENSENKFESPLEFLTELQRLLDK